MNMRHPQVMLEPISPAEKKQQLRAKLLAELAGGKKRTTVQLAALVGVELNVAYHALTKLQKEELVTSFKDRRKGVSDAPPLVWSLVGAPQVIEPLPPRDPLLWALYGGQR